MNIPSRRKLAAAALIIAGLGAFLVPFLLHGPNTQGTPSNNGNPGGTSTNPSNTGGGSGNTGTCSGDDSSDPGHSHGRGKGQSGNHGKHKGLAKQLENSAKHMLDKMARHNPAFREHSVTRTDNDISDSNGRHNGLSVDQDSSCATDTEDEDD